MAADGEMNQDFENVGNRFAVNANPLEMEPEIRREAKVRAEAYIQGLKRNLGIQQRRAAQMGAVQAADGPPEYDEKGDVEFFIQQEVKKQMGDQKPPLRGQRFVRPKRKRVKNPDSAYSYRKKRKLKKDRKKRAPTKWVRALKIANERGDGAIFCIPRKGTAQHREVLEIMAQL